MANSRGPPAAAPLLLAFLQLVSATSSATQVHNLHWNASNPFFRGTAVIDVNAGNHPWEYDQVNIVCPVYKSGSDPSDAEQYIIYSVSKREYETCRITQPDPKIVALCNRPHELMYFTITFRSFTPTPGGLEFSPGQDYYFISTSSRGDLHRRVGGGCATHNMRVMFKVAPAGDEAESEDDNVVSDLRLNKQRVEAGGSRPVPPGGLFPWSRQSDFRRTFSSSPRREPESEVQQRRSRRPKHTAGYEAAPMSSTVRTAPHSLALTLCALSLSWRPR